MAEEEQEVTEEGGEEKEEPKFEYCEACGIQLMNPEDHGGGKADNKWCKDCCKEDGTHLSREEIKERTKKIISSPDGYYTMGGDKPSEEELDKMSEEYMKKLPAWEEKGEKKED
jgi:Putative zinc ribbon domain